MHQIFHVVALVAFLIGLAVAFLGAVAPILFGDRTALRLPTLKASLVIGLAAFAALALDWVVHNAG